MTSVADPRLLLLPAFSGALCLAIALEGLFRRGGLAGVRVAITSVALGSSLAALGLVGAGFEPSAAEAVGWHAAIRVGVAFVGSGAVGIGYVLAAHRPRRPALLVVGLGLGFSAIGLGVALRTDPSTFVRTPVSWFPQGAAFRIFDAAVVGVGTAAVFAAILRRWSSRSRHLRQTVHAVLGLQAVATAAFLGLRFFGSATEIQTFAPVLTSLTAIAYWGVLQHSRLGGVSDDGLALLFGSMPLPAVVLDLRSDRAVLNPPAQTLLGTADTPDALVARLGLGVSVDEVLARFVDRGHAELRVPGVPARVFELRCHLDERRGLGLLVLHEVTERVEHAADLSRTLAELREMQERLLTQEKMAALGTLVAGVNHELNNPLAYVKSNLRSLEGYVNTLGALVPLARAAAESEPGALDALSGALADSELLAAEEDARLALSDAKDGCLRIQDTVSSMRLLSQQGETPHVLDLSELARAGVKIGRTNLQAGIEVHAELGPALAVRGAAGELTQVVTNLIVNAGQALGESGKVFVRTYAVDGLAVLEVEDDGPGVPEQLRARIFEPFFTTKAPGQGTGLGLAISYETLRRHDGELRLVSAPGKGARFQMRLPAVDGDELSR